jgi:catechol 2,3-dioxygenase-like lactoylglutathione lyase family enzyme
MKLTPVLYVESIEKSLPFWIGRLGFQKVVEVPEGDRLGFVILLNNRAEVMLQRSESAAKDVPDTLPKDRTQQSSVYIEVEDFEEARRQVDGCEILLPERTTFYGAREIFVREPGGHVVALAARVAQIK